MDFEIRIQNSGMKDKIRQACTAIIRQLRNRRGRPKQPLPIPDHGAWAQAWIQEKGGPKKSSEAAMIEDWKEKNRSNRNDRTVPSEMAYKGGYLRFHEKLTKAKSSILVQARTRKIGLRAFLF